MWRAFDWWRFHCTFSKHAFRRRIEDEKVIVLVGDNDGIAHVRQDGAQDFVGAGELGSAACYFLFQLVSTLAQCPLQFPLLGNVGVSSKPARNFALSIEDGKRTRKEPSVFTRFTLEWKGVLPRLAGCERNLDTFNHSVDLIRVMDLLPTPSFHLLQRGSGVLVPAVVVPKNVTFTVGHPGELGYGVCQSPELPLSGRRLRVSSAMKQI